MKRAAQKKFTTVDLDGNKVELLCVRPNQDVLDGARLEHSVKYAAALRQGVLTRAEAEDIIEKRNLWSDKHEEDFQVLRKELRDMEVKLRGVKDLTIGKELAELIAAKRSKITRFTNTRNDILGKTCEGYAEAAQNQYLLTRCILKEDTREAYFESLDKFRAMENSQLINDCLAEMMLFILDLSIDDVTATPEGKWLVDRGLVDKETGFYKTNGKLYDIKGRRVNALGEYISEDNDMLRLDEFGYPIEVINESVTETVGVTGESN